jgi:hypothetical protein
MPVNGDPSEPLAFLILVFSVIGLAAYLYDGIRNGKWW